MKPLGYAPQALTDLAEIAAYIAEDDPDRAARFVGELRAKAAMAAERPQSYRERRDLSPGLRAIGHGRHLILFRDLPDEIRVARVVHSARDLPRLFFP